MSQSTLSKLLALFEESSGALSLRDLAQELEVSPGRLDGMIDFWVRKGKIRLAVSEMDCGSCGVKGECPLVINLPRTYVLADDGSEPALLGPPCGKE